MVRNDKGLVRSATRLYAARHFRHITLSRTANSSSFVAGHPTASYTPGKRATAKQSLRNALSRLDTDPNPPKRPIPHPTRVVPHSHLADPDSEQTLA